MLNSFVERLKYPYSTGCLTDRPFRSIIFIIIIIIADIFKIKFKYKNNFFKSNFVFNYKPYQHRGLGGKGQFILREYYDKFFFVGHKILPKKFNFIDIGCSRGFFTFYLLGLQKFKGKGLCIDPLTQAIKDLKEVQKLNKIKSLSFIKGVISNKNKKNQPIFKVSGEGFFSIIKNVPFADKNFIRKKKQVLHVPSYTIDNLVTKKRKIKNLKFIKIDAEGAEFEIISASKKTIKLYKPIFYCEVTRKKQDIFKFFKKNNYFLFCLKNKKLTPILNNRLKTGELLAIHKDDNYFLNIQ